MLNSDVLVWFRLYCCLASSLFAVGDKTSSKHEKLHKISTHQILNIYIYYNLNINKGQLEKLVALKPLISKKMMKEPSLESAC